MPENSVNIVKREINDTQRAYERAIREKKAFSIGLKSISKKDAKAYALEARKTFDEYVQYSQKNKVAYYPDRYVTDIMYKGIKGELWINVGRNKYDKKLYLYDLAPKKI